MLQFLAWELGPDVHCLSQSVQKSCAYGKQSGLHREWPEWANLNLLWPGKNRAGKGPSLNQPGMDRDCTCHSSLATATLSLCQAPLSPSFFSLVSAFRPGLIPALRWAHMLISSVCYFYSEPCAVEGKEVEQRNHNFKRPVLKKAPHTLMKLEI